MKIPKVTALLNAKPREARLAVEERLSNLRRAKLFAKRQEAPQSRRGLAPLRFPKRTGRGPSANAPGGRR